MQRTVFAAWKLAKSAALMARWKPCLKLFLEGKALPAKSKESDS